MLAVVGTGRMGRLVAELAGDRGWTVTALIGRADNPEGAGITRDRLAGAEVAVEFTTAGAAPHNVRALARAGCPVVCGTTGWQAEFDGVVRDVTSAGGALLWAPNFALGMQVFWRVAEAAAERAASLPGFDAHIVETHHAAKRDAPSGTARELQRRVAARLGREVAVTSLRLGSVPGTHELVFDGAFEQIRVVHEARDRRVFAEGALAAAQWIIGRTGVFGMHDVTG